MEKKLFKNSYSTFFFPPTTTRMTYDLIDQEIYLAVNDWKLIFFAHFVAYAIIFIFYNLNKSKKNLYLKMIEWQFSVRVLRHSGLYLLRMWQLTFSAASRRR